MIFCCALNFYECARLSVGSAFHSICPSVHLSICPAPASGHPGYHICVYRSARMLSCFRDIQLFVTPWTVAHQAPLSTRFSRQEYWSRMPFPPPGDLLNPGIKPRSLTFPALAGEFLTTSATREAPRVTNRSNLGVQWI